MTSRSSTFSIHDRELAPPDLQPDDFEGLRVRLAPLDIDLAIDLRKHPETRPLLNYAGARLTAGFDYEGRFPWLDIALEASAEAALSPKRRHMSQELIRLVDAVAEAGEPTPHGVDNARATFEDLVAWGISSPRLRGTVGPSSLDLYSPPRLATPPVNGRRSTLQA